MNMTKLLLVAILGLATSWSYNVIQDKNVALNDYRWSEQSVSIYDNVAWKITTKQGLFPLFPYLQVIIPQKDLCEVTVIAQP